MIRKIMKIVYITLISLYKGFYKIVIMPMKKNLLGNYGRNVYLGRGSTFYYENVFLGNNVSIGVNANFICKLAKIRIEDNVMFGPNVTLITGGHRIDVLGEYMINVNEKLPENDRDIIIEEDVWVGANVTILKGVTVGRGSVIGAGSIVTKDIPPYSICVGVPAKVVKKRFTNEEVIEHEKILGK